MDKGKVHSGFGASYIELEGMGIKSYLGTLDKVLSPEKIVFCGHSLGGALATIAASFFPKKGLLITFGSPRVGNYKFARAFKTEAFRYANLMDPVSHVPPTLALLGAYRHVGTPMHLLKKVIVLREPNPREWSFTSISAVKEHFLGQSEELFDHSPLSYAKKLKRAFLGQTE
jgi:pimeloyl-ACP methyl ester carboxylesterase